VLPVPGHRTHLFVMLVPRSVIRGWSAAVALCVLVGEGMVQQEWHLGGV